MTLQSKQCTLNVRVYSLGYQSTHHTINLSHLHVITWSTRTTLSRNTVAAYNCACRTLLLCHINKH